MHKTTPDFWERFEALPEDIQKLARKNFRLLQADPRHPSLHFKRAAGLYSARVGINFRALAFSDGDDIVWFWIGGHTEYERIIKSN